MRTTRNAARLAAVFGIVAAQGEYEPGSFVLTTEATIGWGDLLVLE